MRAEDGKETASSCGHCPTSAPVTREPLGSLLTWISLSVGGLCLPAWVQPLLRGLCPAVFPGSPSLWREPASHLPPPSPALPHLARSPACPLSHELFHASLPCSPFKAPVGPGWGDMQASQLEAWAWCDLGSAHQPFLSLPAPPAPQALYTKVREAHLHLTSGVCCNPASVYTRNRRGECLLRACSTSLCAEYFFKGIYLFISVWLCWVFVAVRGLSLVVASRGYSLLWGAGFWLQWPVPLWSTVSRLMGFGGRGAGCGLLPLEPQLTGCGTWAWLLHGTWNLPGPGSNPCPLQESVGGHLNYWPPLGSPVLSV